MLANRYRITSFIGQGSTGAVFRADDVIVRGGFKVRASDVEAALRSHDAVDDAVVVGIPDARLGAVPAAMVHLRDDEARLARRHREHRLIGAQPRSASRAPSARART